MLKLLPRIIASAVLLTAAIAQAGIVKVVVKVPVDTPASDSVYLAGSLPSVGGWKVDGVRLWRENPTTFCGDIDAEPGQTLAYKFNRGTWGTVEKNADGTDRANRSITIEAATKTIEATVLRWGEGSASPSSVVGRLSLDLLLSPTLGGSRMLRVWLPPSYYTDPQAKFDVLYMNDGQNCFDASTSSVGKEWRIDETITGLVNKGRLLPIIVIGIDHGGGERINEYTFDADNGRGGKGATYAKFLLEEVKPFVERNYRVNTGAVHTFIGGSSLGGLISLDIARRHPGVFGGVIAMSPSLSWNGESLTKEVAKDLGGLAGARVWIDVGTNEGTTKAEAEKYQKTVQAMYRVLSTGPNRPWVTPTFYLDNDAQHNEDAWARRFPEAIRFVTKSE